MTNPTTYQPPVNKLLTLGKQQCDYITELGLGSQHVPELMKMAVDNELLGADSNSTQFWAAIHAWRALGQLRVEDAIAVLLPLFDLEDNDAVAEEMPKVYGTIGEKAIPQLQTYLGERSHGLLNRTTAINSLEEIANQYPNTRNEIVAVFTGQLKQFNQNSAELNGFIVSSLVNLQAKESASLIKYTFDTSLVAEDIVGSWDDVRESLGISDDNQLEEFQPEASQKFEVVVEEATTPSLELHQDDNYTVESVEEVITADNIQVVETEIVKEVTTPFVELHQDNSTIESAGEVACDDVLEVEVIEDETTQMQQFVEAASEKIQESTLSDIVAQMESILDNAKPIETRVKESIAVDDVTKSTTDSLIDNDNESLEKLSSDDVTVITTAKEQNKGFGGTSIKKEKSKGSKKKKPNFNDL